MRFNKTLLLFILIPLFYHCQSPEQETGAEKKWKSLNLPALPGTEKPKNVIFILSDDHRYDFMGFTGKVPWLKTPAMDKMAMEGAHIQNAFVTTSLCSPSRASILTGMFSHKHSVVDNQAPVPDNLIFFPQYLQKAGYQTAFFGKWHMGHDSDDPRPGFDHWESFRGQGNYYQPTLNIDGETVSYDSSTYITDLLTDHAIEWLGSRDQDNPFFMYLSHKAVHAMFEPAEVHKGMYKDEKVIYPPSYYLTVGDEYKKHLIPEWVKEQRYSWHGVDNMYHGAYDFETFFKAYCETLMALDESVGSILDFVENSDLLNNTVVIYMGDNGFSFGEHGLIDKRQAYEESWRVPMMAWSPGLIEPGTRITQLVQNIDIAPTILELAGLAKPNQMDGASFWPILKGDKTFPWRDKIFYEYYWEYAYPQTPTVHAVRTDRYKFIRYHGIWDTNELYDLQEDPWEMNNLIESPDHQEMIHQMLDDLWTWLEETGGMQIPLKRTMHKKLDNRYQGYY
jgi:N-acetylglucosamine-6-sulfatase